MNEKDKLFKTIRYIVITLFVLFLIYLFLAVIVVAMASFPT